MSIQLISSRARSSRRRVCRCRGEATPHRHTQTHREFRHSKSRATTGTDGSSTRSERKKPERVSGRDTRIPQRTGGTSRAPPTTSTAIVSTAALILPPARPHDGDADQRMNEPARAHITHSHTRGGRPTARSYSSVDAHRTHPHPRDIQTQ